MKWFIQNNITSVIPITYSEKMRKENIVYETVKIVGKVQTNDLLKLIENMTKIQGENRI